MIRRLQGLSELFRSSGTIGTRRPWKSSLSVVVHLHERFFPVFLQGPIQRDRSLRSEQFGLAFEHRKPRDAQMEEVTEAKTADNSGRRTPLPKRTRQSDSVKWRADEDGDRRQAN
jgi:hypothetical protein